MMVAVTEREAMLDPRVAHHVPVAVLMRHLPHANQTDVMDLRHDFARFLTTRAASTNTWTTWQEAWNTWTGATPTQPGSIRYTPTRCPACHGKGFNATNVMHNLNRTGTYYMCGECRGTRRGNPTTLAAYYIPVPEDTNDSDGNGHGNGHGEGFDL